MKHSHSLLILSGFVAFMLLLAFGFRIDRRANEPMLVGNPFPVFNQQTLKNKIFSHQKLKGHLTLWHVWATWCHTCEADWSMIKAHQHDDIDWVGMIYQDTEAHVNKWYAAHDNPFSVTLMDAEGVLAFDLGVTGVPETFLIDTHGIIRAKWEGPLSPQRWQKDILPMIHTLQNER